ncbi:SDR family oxidoreductase [Mucilaginibacter kameinonensis]|uniref:SDR family oxidoreductase n=1 Tax=Mucilaginibacter kameinonensis TaxID=452286 RepID=UPI000EF81F1B|nr:SDR family oxidoreductase [Mucilaginibacter kameinonensis]
MSTQKIAFITGGNRGIGFETAKQLGELGYLPVIGARNPAQGQEAIDKLKTMGISARYIKFDATLREDHLSAFDYFSTHFDRLDILINNAGASFEGDPVSASKIKDATENVSEPVLRDTMEVNFFNVVFLTQALLPLIKKSEAGRIVNVSSRLGSLTTKADFSTPLARVNTFAYDTSKTALNSFTVHLANELKNTAIKVNSSNPGWVSTALGGAAGTSTPEDGAKTSVYLATLPDDGPTGKFLQLEEEIPW